MFYRRVYFTRMIGRTNSGIKTKTHAHPHTLRRGGFVDDARANLYNENDNGNNSNNNNISRPLFPRPASLSCLIRGANIRRSKKKAGGLLSVFLAAWSVDPRGFADEAAAAGRSAANRIRTSDFCRGSPRVSEVEKMVVPASERGPDKGDKW